MDNNRFGNLVEERLDSCMSTLIQKDKEYGSEKDRLHNFKVAAAIKDETVEEALLGMWVKHIVSIVDLMKNPETATKELLKEKFGDNINYSLLAEAVLTERIEGKESKVVCEVGKHVQSQSMHHEPKVFKNLS